jgi:hypothetical protein
MSNVAALCTRESQHAQLSSAELADCCSSIEMCCLCTLLAGYVVFVVVCAADDKVIVTASMTNGGNVMLIPSVTLSALTGDFSCPSDPLAPGKSMTCTHNGHSITQSDINNGKIVEATRFVGAPTAQGLSPVSGVQSITVFASDLSQFSVKVDIVNGQNFNRAGEV